MKVEIKTKFGVLNYDMPDDKVSRLLTYAAKFAAGEPLRQPNKKEPAPAPAAEPEIIRAKSRVEAMFGEKKTWDMPAAGTAPQQVPKIKPYKPAKGYTGFIITKCDRCGAERGFCTKGHITKSLCSKCGHDMELGEMTVAHLDCACCGKSFTYRTNIKAPVFVHDCLDCGTPIIAKLNAAGNTYVTYRDRELMGTLYP